jgi:hypothetical protein
MSDNPLGKEVSSSSSLLLAGGQNVNENGTNTFFEQQVGAKK